MASRARLPSTRVHSGRLVVALRATTLSQRTTWDARLRSSAEEHRASNPGVRGSNPLGGFTAPWPSGEARACKARRRRFDSARCLLDNNERRAMSTIKTFGEVDQRSLDQLERCMTAGDAAFGVLCADHHPGYSQPIGGGVAYEGYISPSGVGYDIGCGNKAVETELTRDDLDALGGVEAVMDEITRRISFGMGVPAQERVDHPVLEKIRHADFAPQRKLAQLAESQLGTVGSGNHYVNVMEDEEGRIWIGVHFGSRGFGHKTASGFLALAQGLAFDAKAHDGEMDSPPVLFETGSELGDAYVAAMELAGEYAYAGRDVVVEKVLDILGAEAVHEVHNHHNFAWREEHFGRTYWVVRKGCTPARPGQEGFVGGSMGDDSVILEGVDSVENEQVLYSTVHGAGR